MKILSTLILLIIASTVFGQSKGFFFRNDTIYLIRDAGDTIKFASVTQINSMVAGTNEMSASRSFNSAFQVSSSTSALVRYTVQIAATLSLTTGQTGTVFLETSPDNSNWTTKAQFTNGNTGTLTIGLNLTQTLSSTLVTKVQPGYWVRLRTTGTATITYLYGFENY